MAPPVPTLLPDPCPGMPGPGGSGVKTGKPLGFQMSARITSSPGPVPGMPVVGGVPGLLGGLGGCPPPPPFPFNLAKTALRCSSLLNCIGYTNRLIVTKHNPAFIQFMSDGASLLKEPIAKQTAAAIRAAVFHMIIVLSDRYKNRVVRASVVLPVPFARLGYFEFPDGLLFLLTARQNWNSQGLFTSIFRFA